MDRSAATGLDTSADTGACSVRFPTAHGRERLGRVSNIFLPASHHNTRYQIPDSRSAIVSFECL
jgi:hypothetical protein